MEKFYREVVETNKNNQGGWASFYYGTFSNLIKQKGFKKCAEIGIGYGLHAKQILENTPEDVTLILVDPHQAYPNDQFSTDVTKHGTFDELFQQIKKELSPYQKRFTHFRKFSTTITPEEVPDGSLDTCFVDANHEYRHVLEDLNFWYRKVRSGGVLCGDDYWMSDVARAVHDFSKQHGLQTQFLDNPTKKTYKIYAFTKP